ncbi:MAG: hypothetical protein OEV64_06710, partial [Desulfobulbaceae bacterium]|nr:hypothetical protein [Desulfobulbaceae bacterium]
MLKRKSATWIGYFITSLTLLVFSGCAASGPGLMPGEGDSPLDLQTCNIEEYQLLIEEVLSSREITLNFYRELNQKLADGHPLNGEDMETLNLGLKSHLDLRERLYQVALAYEDWVDDPPEGLDEDQRLQGVMLSLSAALVLYDNYLLAVSTYEENGKLRRYIDSPHPEYH